MSGRGRPRDTYADDIITSARRNTGHWIPVLVKNDEANRLVRKLRRDGLEARYMILDEAQAFVAVKENDEAG